MAGLEPSPYEPLRAVPKNAILIWRVCGIFHVLQAMVGQSSAARKAYGERA